LSYRDVEDLLAERGLEVSYETVRRWVLKFGPVIARRLRRRQLDRRIRRPRRHRGLEIPKRDFRRGSRISMFRTVVECH
jgi:hypothetical protein